MTTNQKYVLAGLTTIILFFCAWYIGMSLGNLNAYGAEFPQQSNSPKAHASSTVYSVTWGQTATRLVATSSRLAASATLPATSGRTALTVQTVNCGAGANVWLQFNDVLPATTTGYSLAASSTITFGDDIPMVNGTLRALAATANCTLMVTEWRSEN